MNLQLRNFVFAHKIQQKRKLYIYLISKQNCANGSLNEIKSLYWKSAVY